MWGIVKKLAQRVGILIYQLYKSSPVPGRGGVGYCIDRCIERINLVGISVIVYSYSMQKLQTHYHIW